MGNTSESLRGKLLLDGGQLAGSFFARTVVLVCQHDAEGAFGLVLNRPSGKQAGELLVADLPDLLEESPVFVGGPVQTDTAIAIARSPAVCRIRRMGRGSTRQ